MATLYIRDVDDAVTEALKAKASAEGKSLSAYVAGELRKLATRPTNAEIVARLRSLDRTEAVETNAILQAVAAGRR
ncbi:FitA-like ribbon-helix-helix domain-containing protein [Actinomycetota bacterium]